MKLLRRAMILCLAVLVLGGCTKSSFEDPEYESEHEGINVEDLIQGEEETEEFDPRKMDIQFEDDEPVETGMFDWEQVDYETSELFGDEETYPLGVKMSYEADEDARSIKLSWVLKNEATEADAMEYAYQMVRFYNDILAVQVSDMDFSTSTTFGGVWNSFSLQVQMSKEDGTVLLDKSYAAGEAIDLEVPEFEEGMGPMDPEEDGKRKSERD